MFSFTSSYNFFFFKIFLVGVVMYEYVNAAYIILNGKLLSVYHFLLPVFCCQFFFKEFCFKNTIQDLNSLNTDLQI